MTDTLIINNKKLPAAAMLSAPNSGGNGLFAATALWLPGSLAALVGFTRRKQLSAPARRLFLLALLCLVLGGAGIISGCGSSTNAAKAGSYSIPITLTLSGATTENVNATVTIQ